MFSKIATIALGAAAATISSAAQLPTTVPATADGEYSTEMAMEATEMAMKATMMPKMEKPASSFMPMTAAQIRSTFDSSAYVLDLKNALQVPGEGRLLELGEQQSFPILAVPDTQTSFARLTFDNGASNPVHLHPRATELLYVVKGRVECVMTKELGNEGVMNTIEMGQATVFPKGLAHGQKCVAEGGCVFLSVLNSADPGAYGVTI